jgi:hypothetical protein|tara:strand:- start:153 stop:293 length:141 start_codon:yes stop_codon:yes gene_type:complete
MSPGIPIIWKTVDHHDEWSLPDANIMDPSAIVIDISVGDLLENVRD